MRRAVYFLILFAFVWLLAKPVFALSQEIGGNKEEIDKLNAQILEKQSKINLLEKSIDEYRDKIKQKRLEAVSLSNQMAILDNRISQVELDIKATEEKLAAIGLEIETLNLIIADKEKAIAKQKGILAELLRTLYEQNDKSYVEIAAVYDNFSDFYNQLQYVQVVQRELGTSLRALKTAKTELEQKHKQVTDRKLIYEESKKQLSEKRRDLNEQVYAKQNLLAQTHMSELKFNTMLANLRQQYQAIEGEIAFIEKEMRRKLEEQAALEKITGDSSILAWPTLGRYITSAFHDPEYPYRHIFEHNGVDIRTPQGTPVKAAASGYVARARRCSISSCYSYVMLIHSRGIATVYGHLNGIVVSEDQFVARGDIIGYSGGIPGTVGAGPFVTGPHLHFEVRKNGIPVDPMNYLVQ